MKILSGVYKIRNRENNLIYVGSSTNIEYRWRGHKALLRHNKHHNSHLQNAWNKYGEDAFEFLVIEEVLDEKFILNREDFWLIKTNCCNKEFGYNISEKAGRPNHSAETRAKIKESRKNYKPTEETKKKIGLSSLGNISRLGQKRSEEEKKKGSDSLKKYYQENQVSEETREKLRIANTGKKASPETIQKLRDSHKGNQSRVVYSKEFIETLKQEKAAGSTQIELAKKYKIAPSTMSYLLNKRL